MGPSSMQPDRPVVKTGAVVSAAKLRATFSRMRPLPTRPARARRAATALAALGLLLACRPDAGDSAARGDRAGSASSTSAASSAGSATANLSYCWRTPVIVTGGVASVRLGGTVADIARNCAVRDSTFTLGEGMSERGVVVGARGHQLVAITTGDSAGVISRMIVADTLFRTAAGVRVGSTLGTLREEYGGAVCEMMGEGQVVVRTPRLPGVSFALDTDIATLPAGGRSLGRAPSPLPDSSRITRIFLYEAGLDGAGECGRAG